MTRKNIHDYEAISERVKGFKSYFQNNVPDAHIDQLKFDLSDGFEKGEEKNQCFFN